jgi:hypothetical protein
MALLPPASVYGPWAVGWLKAAVASALKVALVAISDGKGKNSYGWL